jgi:hypothetical protein
MLEQADHRVTAGCAKGSVSFSDMGRTVGEIDKVSVKTGLGAAVLMVAQMGGLHMLQRGKWGVSTP